MILVDVATQRLWHRRRSGVLRCYRVSTAARGVGALRDSWRTPPGRHRIAERIGEGLPLWTYFVAREPRGLFDPRRADERKDWILTRVIRLAGDQTGVNRRGARDTFQRMIYIHGTHDEAALGHPASHGCIRMAPVDIVELFDYCHCREVVYIR